MLQNGPKKTVYSFDPFKKHVFQETHIDDLKTEDG